MIDNNCPKSDNDSACMKDWKNSLICYQHVAEAENVKTIKKSTRIILTGTYSDLGGEVGEQVCWRTKNATNLQGEGPMTRQRLSNLQVRPGGLRYVIYICEMWLVSSKRGWVQDTSLSICERNPKTICPRHLVGHLWREIPWYYQYKKQCPVTYVSSPNCRHIVRIFSFECELITEQCKLCGDTVVMCHGRRFRVLTRTRTLRTAIGFIRQRLPSQTGRSFRRSRLILPWQVDFHNKYTHIFEDLKGQTNIILL